MLRKLFWIVRGVPGGLLGASEGVREASWGVLGLSGRVRGASWAGLGHSWGDLGAAFKAVRFRIVFFPGKGGGPGFSLSGSLPTGGGLLGGRRIFAAQK